MFVSRQWKKDLEGKSKRLAHLESKTRSAREEPCPVITPMAMADLACHSNCLLISFRFVKSGSDLFTDIEKQSKLSLHIGSGNLKC